MFVQLKNVEFSYGLRQILNNISFSIEQGETVAVVGASGSGKSTLLRLISGILPHLDNTFSGLVDINTITPGDYLRKSKLAFMFQRPTLFPNLSVKENIEMPLKIQRKIDKKKINNLIRTVGLKGYEDYLPKQLSGGMKTRVALARSFVTTPELLLLDEPFSSLDIAWKDTLYHELKQLVKSFNTTVVLVTHDINEAITLSDKIICLGKKGEVIFCANNDKTNALRFLVEEIIISDHALR